MEEEKQTENKEEKKKRNAYWTEEEKNLLKKLCSEAKTFKELKAKIEDSFPNHNNSWSAISDQVRRNPKWIKHFEKKQKPKPAGEKDIEKEKKIDTKGEKVILTAEEDKLLKALLKNPMTVESISERLNIAKENVWPVIDKFRAKGYEITEENRLVFLQKEPVSGRVTTLPHITKSEIKILILSDLGIGLKTQQPDLLATVYQMGEEAGVYFAIVMDASAGKPKKDKENEYIQELWSFEEQLDYVASYFPKASFNTYFLNGPRDLSHMTKKEPQNFGYSLGEMRDDLRYLGDLQATIEVKNAKIALNIDSGSPAYTKSYPSQGVVENYQDASESVFGDEENPDIVLIGGLYSIFQNPPRLPFNKKYRNNIYSLNIPSLHAMTASQRTRRRRGGSSVIGALILSLEFNRDGNLKKVVPDWRPLNAYVKKRDFLTDIKMDSDLTDCEKEILDLLVQNPRSRGDLSRKINKSISSIEETIEKLNTKNYTIIFSQAEKKYKLLRGLKTEFKPLDTKKLFVKTAKFAFTSDHHIGSKESVAETYLPVIYKECEEANVQKIYGGGDNFEGEFAYKGQTRALTHHGADEQRDYGLKIFPKSNIPTELIMGSSHELVYWNNCGHNIVEAFCHRGRHIGKKLKLKYIGLPNKPSTGISKVNGIGLRLVHPKGGIPHGLSYRLQNWIEKYITVFSKEKEKVLACGHLHVAAFMIYKGIAGFLIPCLQEQTQYLAEKGLIPWLGFWIIEVSEDANGNITRVVPEYIAFESKNR